jgi:hypothetical protein
VHSGLQNTVFNCSVFPLASRSSSRNQLKTSSRVCTLSGSRSSSSRTPSPLGSYTVCAYPDLSTTCAGRFRLYILWSTHASIFDDTLRRGIREILSTKISDLEWARLKSPLDLGGACIFDIYNTAKSGFVASYQECFKHAAIHFPVIKDLMLLRHQLVQKQFFNNRGI